MAGSLLLSRILGVLRDTIIASKFGLQDINDSYRIATAIPDMIFMLIAGGGLSSAFIPVFTEFWYTGRQKAAWKAFSVVVTICSIAAVFLIVVAWVLAPVIVPLYGYSKPEVIQPAILMSRIMLPAQFAFLIGSIMLATLYSRKQFYGPGLAPNIYNVGIILGAAKLPGIFGFGIVGVAWGALGGAFIGNILLPLFLMIPQGDRFTISLDLKTPGVGKFFKLLLPVILGFSLPSMVNIVTQFFGSSLGSGSNTVLSYSNALMQAPLAIFGQSFAMGIFPLLSQLFAEKRMELYRDMLARTLRTTLYFSVPSAVLMFALAPMIVKILYGYGRASSQPSELDLIATCVRIFCLSIPAWCLQPCLMRGFFSLHKTFKPVAYGTAMTLFYILARYLLRPSKMDVVNLALTQHIPVVDALMALKVRPLLLALPWAMDISALILVAILFVALEGEIGKMSKGAVIKTFFQCAAVAAPVGGIAYAAMLAFPHSGKLLTFAWFLVIFLVTGLLYILGTKMFGMTEADSVLRRFRPLRNRLFREKTKS
jgi:putative peptidoglycan lipid II flippase